MGIFITSRRQLLLQNCVDRLHGLMGRALEALHTPAKIREFEYVDQNTNETVYLSTGARYSVLHVGDKQFFFDRFTGRFDGTCTSLELSVSDGLELRD
jgi:hypothetical protein